MLEQTLNILDRVEDHYVPLIAEGLSVAMINMATAIRDEYRPAELSPPHRRVLIKLIAGVWWDSANMTGDLMDIVLTQKNENRTRLLVDDFASHYGSNRSAQILRTTERQVQDLIRGGMAKGESAATVFDKLFSRIPELAKTRAAIITRTDAHAASQYTALRLAVQSQKPLSKIWNSTPDSRIRDFGLSGRVSDFNHRIMNGQEAALTQTFKVPTKLGGFEALQFPGDPSGSAGNIINCRCIQTFQPRG